MQCLVKGNEERRKLCKAIQKYEHSLDIKLSDQQDEETQKLVMVIEAKGKNQLVGIISETQQMGNEVGYDVLQAWQRNVTFCKDFFNDQLWSCKCNG